MLKMSLKSAMEQYQESPGSIAKSYQYYRREAQQAGRVNIEGIDVSVVKIGGRWLIFKEDFLRAMDEYKGRLAKIKTNTENLKRGGITGKIGEIVPIDGGYYINHGLFREEVSTYAAAKRRDYGVWYCNKCMCVATTENNKPECHNCREGWTCGRDCTLSKVICEKCGAVKDI